MPTCINNESINIEAINATIPLTINQMVTKLTVITSKNAHIKITANHSNTIIKPPSNNIP